MKALREADLICWRFHLLKINRRPGTQDVSWFLDQHRHKRLDVDPPYQRRSVWTPKDRRYFLDTLFRGYPCPPIYLHKTIDTFGLSTYHVVDGKQRIETVIRFAENKVRIPDNYGDERLDNKRWKDIFDDVEMRNSFLNYPFVVEYFDDVEGTIVNEIFERMNRNSRKLTPQELRNARYDGWFSREVVPEVEEPVWRQLGVVTTGRARRMADMQFIAELFMVIIYKRITGFEHAFIDQTYALYEDLDNPDLEFDQDAFKHTLDVTRRRIIGIQSLVPDIREYLSSVANMYTLWAFLVLHHPNTLSDDQLAEKYKLFMDKVYEFSQRQKEIGKPPNSKENYAPEASSVDEFVEYYNANQSATTELPQRTQRLNALRKALSS